VVISEQAVGQTVNQSFLQQTVDFHLKLWGNLKGARNEFVTISKMIR